MSASRLSSLTELMRVLAAEPESRPLTDALAQGARMLLGAKVALVASRAPGSDRLSVEAHAGAQVAQPIAPGSAIARADAERQTICVDGLRVLDGAPEVRALAAVPLGRDQRQLGVLAVGLTEGRRFTEEELRLLELLAEHAALALARAHATAQSTRRLARVEEHGAVLRRIADAHRRELVVDRALDAATTLFGADRAAVYVADARENVLAVYGRRLSRAYMETVARVYRNSAGGLLFRIGAPVFVADLRTDHRTRVLHAEARAEGLHSALLVPLTSRQRPIGALALYHDIEWSYDAEDVTLVRTLADQVALSLVDAAMHEESDRREARLRALAALGAVFQGSPAGEEPERRRARAVAALTLSGCPSAWLLERRGEALDAVAQAGPGAIDPRQPEQAARAALEAGRAVVVPAEGGRSLLAAPIGEPVARGVLVLSPPRATPGEPRAGTVVVAFEDERPVLEHEPFAAAAAGLLAPLFAEPAAAAAEVKAS